MTSYNTALADGRRLITETTPTAGCKGSSHMQHLPGRLPSSKLQTRYSTPYQSVQINNQTQEELVRCLAREGLKGPIHAGGKISSPSSTYFAVTTAEPTWLQTSSATQSSAKPTSSHGAGTSTTDGAMLSKGKWFVMGLVALGLVSGML